MNVPSENTDTDPLPTRHSMLACVRAGDTQAWEWFAERYRAFVADALARSIWPRARADEAAAQFWGYVFESRAIDRADPTQRFRGFLMGTLRNYALSWCRQQRERHVVQPAEGAVPEAPSFDAMPEEEEAALWTRHVLALGLAELARENERQAQALRWFYAIPDAGGSPPVEAMKGSQIAKRLGLDANATHQLLFRARKRLRALVEHELQQQVTRDGDLQVEMRSLVESAGRSAPGLLGPLHT